jgi:hypothetical protein
MFNLVLWDTKDVVTMNFFYDLPDDLQEKIYKHTHEIQSNNTFGKIKKIDFWRRDDGGYSILSMTRYLYDTDVSQKELRDYYFCLDWLDGKKLNITIEDIDDNLYYHVYCDYWDQVAESEYHNGDYI